MTHGSSACAGAGPILGTITEVQVRRLLAGFAFVVVVAACGDDPMTLTEYATEVEGLVATMEAQFDALDQDWLSGAPTVERAVEYWDVRIEIRDEFLAGIEGLRPSEEMLRDHNQAVALFTRITDADRALAASVATYESIDDHWQWVDTPEGRASDAILAEVYAFCRSSQEDFDATKEREPLADTPWLPAEMKEVVKVAFGCPPAAELTP